MDDKTISVVAALIRDATGRVLLVRKRCVWVDPKAPPDLSFAPLTRDHVLPLAAR
jgi:hypothetical protein